MIELFPEEDEKNPVRKKINDIVRFLFPPTSPHIATEWKNSSQAPTGKWRRLPGSDKVVQDPNNNTYMIVNLTNEQKEELMKELAEQGEPLIETEE